MSKEEQALIEELKAELDKARSEAKKIKEQRRLANKKQKVDKLKRLNSIRKFVDSTAFKMFLGGGCALAASYLIPYYGTAALIGAVGKVLLGTSVLTGGAEAVKHAATREMIETEREVLLLESKSPVIEDEE